MLVWSKSIASTASCLRRDRGSDSRSLIAENSRSMLTCATGNAASARLQGRTQWGRMGSGSGGGCLSTLYSTLHAQKRRAYNQLGAVYHHQLQQYPFRVSESLKFERESQRGTAKYPAIGCLTITQPCSKMGWDEVPHIPFCKICQRKGGRPSMADPKRGLREGPLSKKYSDF